MSKMSTSHKASRAMVRERNMPAQYYILKTLIEEGPLCILTGHRAAIKRTLIKRVGYSRSGEVVICASTVHLQGLYTNGYTVFKDIHNIYNPISMDAPGAYNLGDLQHTITKVGVNALPKRILVDIVMNFITSKEKKADG